MEKLKRCRRLNTDEIQPEHACDEGSGIMQFNELMLEFSSHLNRVTTA